MREGQYHKPRGAYHFSVRSNVLLLQLPARKPLNHRLHVVVRHARRAYSKASAWPLPRQAWGSYEYVIYLDQYTQHGDHTWKMRTCFDGLMQSHLEPRYGGRESEGLAWALQPLGLQDSGKPQKCITKWDGNCE